jgi:hypothetical protein
VRYGTGGDGVAIGVSDGGGGDAIVGWAIDADFGRDVGEFGGSRIVVNALSVRGKKSLILGE